MKKESITLDAFKEGKKVEVIQPDQQKEVKGGNNGVDEFVVIDDLDGF